MEDRLLTIAEVAEYLGVARQTVYIWRHKGIGPRSHRFGTTVRYRREDVDAWLAEHADDANGREAG